MGDFNTQTERENINRPVIGKYSKYHVSNGKEKNIGFVI